MARLFERSLEPISRSFNGRRDFGEICLGKANPYAGMPIAGGCAVDTSNALKAVTAMATVTTATSSSSLGELLRRAREHRGLTLERVANETKIPQRHLEAIEHDNLAVIPAGFYQRAEIRAYARAVGLDQGLALAQLESASKPVAPREAPRKTQPTGKPIDQRTKGLIVLGVVIVTAAVLGRVMSEPAPTPIPSAEMRGASNTAPKPESSGDVASPGITTPPSPQPAPDAGLAATTETAKPPLSAQSITELVVTTQPAGARVTVNGVGWGVAPVTIRYLPAGDKRVRVSKEGYVAQERMLRPDEGQRQALDVALADTP
jgi:transcriptional regulator with XRE-family HTH domain